VKVVAGPIAAYLREASRVRVSGGSDGMPQAWAGVGQAWDGRWSHGNGGSRLLAMDPLDHSTAAGRTVAKVSEDHRIYHVATARRSGL